MRTRFVTLASVASLALALGCTESDPAPQSMDAVVPPDAVSLDDDVLDATVTPGTFTAVFIADTHIIGPQYSCCSESEGVDNESIMRTPERLARTRAKINAMVPRPDMVFVLGDIMHDAHHASEVDWYLETPNAFTLAKALFSGFDMPVHFVFGNHDYEVECDPNHTSYDRDFSHTLFRTFYGADPYGAVHHKGWRFLLTNGQLGPTWEIGNDACNTEWASYGRTQLNWIAEELDGEEPTVVLSHYMRLVTAKDEDPEGPHPDLFSLLDARDNVKAVLVGHTHRWIDLTLANLDVPHHVVAATRYDSDNFWTVEFEVDGDQFEILDFDKRIDLSSCSQTWRYDGAPMSVPEAEEDGDCVFGLGN